MFDGIHTALRTSINALSRPYLRDLTVLDFPDEILLMIFELVEKRDINLVFPSFSMSGRRDN